MRRFVVGAMTLVLTLASATAQDSKVEMPKTVGWHAAVYDAEGKLIPWTTWKDAIDREMRWYLDCPLDSRGYPIFVFTTFMDGQYMPYKPEVIPCTQDGMGILSYLKYWKYSGNSKVLEYAKKMGDYLVNETLTPDEGAYPRFTRSTGLHDAFPLVSSSQGDLKCGVNVIEPDKGGIAGYALVKLYEATGDQRYLDQAIHNADLLAENMRQGDAQHSPWPFRVDAITGQAWGERSGDMVFILRLFDELVARGHDRFQSPRTALWQWISGFQLMAPETREQSLWIQFFEDMTEEDNRNSWAPLEMARYLIEKKETLDPDWKAHAEHCIQFALKYFGEARPGGVTIMGEQDSDKRGWGGACSKLGGVAAMFYAAGGGEQYKEIAFRNLTWVTYFIRDDGVVCDQTGEDHVREGGWQEDCHTDVIHNFMDAIAAVPEWAEAGTKADPPLPKTIAYYAAPTPYFNDHAADVARIYDGFFFGVGSWDEGATAPLGLDRDPAAPTEWKKLARENMKHLNGAGALLNLLAVSFSDSAPWPSAETLLAPEYRDTMAKRFGAIAHEAREIGFRGLSIDVEYPYPRYNLENPVYTYDGYTAEDLRVAVRSQGRAVMNAILDAYPGVIVFVLPGSLWSRTLARDFQLAMLETMAERDAPGGFHLGAERSYCLLDPVSQIAIPREGDLSMEALVHDPEVQDYWRRRCSVAPGVWPAHMVETGGKDYPARPWSEELGDLKDQVHILRNEAKRYMWSFSGQPLWYAYSPELEQQYGLKKPTYRGIEELAAGWHAILADKSKDVAPRLQPCLDAVNKYDRGEIDGAELCSRLGTPGEWYVLGPLDNPFVRQAFSAPKAFLGRISPDEAIHGRDGVVRWFPFRNLEPLGHLRITAAFDWGSTDNSSAQWVATVHADKETKAFLWMGWDDGIIVYLNDRVVFDHPTYPERGHGLLFQDKYNFEEKVPVTVPQGDSRLAVVSINLKGSWGVDLRIADEDGYPIEGVAFPRLSEGNWGPVCEQSE